MAEVFDIIVGDCSAYYDAIFSAIRGRYQGLENATIADIGGGTGLFTFHVCDRVKRILLLDPSDAMLRVAKEKSAGYACDNVEIAKEGFPDCGLSPGSVDVIVLIGTFQYLSREEQPAALRDIYRCLKPGGLVFIDLTNYFAFIGKQVDPEMKKWDAKGLKIVQKTSHEVHPFREEWIDIYRITLENTADGGRKEFQSRHVLKMLSPTEIYLLLWQAGFSDIDVISGPAMETGPSVKMWCFAKKQGNTGR